MSGSIRVRDVLAHAPSVIVGFGWLVFWRALFGGYATFLEAVVGQ